ncbi:17247_t:CDS:2, partial [Dentiscutata erythropus]
IDDYIQENANIIEPNVAKTAQQTEEQINKCFKASKKNQKQPTTNSQLNTSEIMIEESAAQSSSFDIEKDNTIKESNLSNDTGASVSVKQTLNYKENSDPSNANEKNQEIYQK